MIETILECVRANDASVVGKEDDTSASATIFHVQELVFDHSQCAVVLASRLSQHNIVVFGLAFAQDALDHIDFIFAHLQFDLFFKKLDHALQNDV